MPITLDHTHDPAARSWLESANGHADFPIQNLPLGVFSSLAHHDRRRGGVAIGDQVLDLAALHQKNVLSGVAQAACELASQSTLNALMQASPTIWRALRHGLFALLADSAPAQTQEQVRQCLLPAASVQLHLPVHVANYTDFYTSIHHARNVGRVVRPDDPLSPNFVWLPIAYHGRASSVVISGTPFRRPMGQAKAPQAASPSYGPCARLDFELEMGILIGQGNALGEPVSLADAESRIFGMCLLNDWSARDHQFWEMNPLGPFLGKNFCTSISPWVVTMEALAPFRVPAAERPAPEPQPLPYLDSPDNRSRGGIDVQLSVGIESEQHRASKLPPSVVSRTSFRHQYWTPAQMVTQHTVGGCNLLPGDLLGTGTISGPTPDQAGAIVELSRGGTVDVALSQTGEVRRFLADGDCVVLSGWCERDGAARIGFGECRGTVLPALG